MILKILNCSKGSRSKNLTGFKLTGTVKTKCYLKCSNFRQLCMQAILYFLSAYHLINRLIDLSSSTF